MALTNASIKVRELEKKLCKKINCLKEKMNTTGALQCEFSGPLGWYAVPIGDEGLDNDPNNWIHIEPTSEAIFRFSRVGKNVTLMVTVDTSPIQLTGEIDSVFAILIRSASAEVSKFAPNISGGGVTTFSIIKDKVLQLSTDKLDYFLPGDSIQFLLVQDDGTLFPAGNFQISLAPFSISWNLVDSTLPE